MVSIKFYILYVNFFYLILVISFLNFQEYSVISTVLLIGQISGTGRRALKDVLRTVLLGGTMAEKKDLKISY